MRYRQILLILSLVPLKDAATQLVFGRGNIHADIMLIGEATGAKEDEQGVPFVGAAGKRLNDLLQTIDIGIDDVYIANILNTDLLTIGILHQRK